MRVLGALLSFNVLTLALQNEFLPQPNPSYLQASLQRQTHLHHRRSGSATEKASSWPIIHKLRAKLRSQPKKQIEKEPEKQPIPENDKHLPTIPASTEKEGTPNPALFDTVQDGFPGRAFWNNRLDHLEAELQSCLDTIRSVRDHWAKFDSTTDLPEEEKKERTKDIESWLRQATDHANLVKESMHQYFEHYNDAYTGVELPDKAGNPWNFRSFMGEARNWIGVVWLIHIQTIAAISDLRGFERGQTWIGEHRKREEELEKKYTQIRIRIKGALDQNPLTDWRYIDPSSHAQGTGIGETVEHPPVVY